MNSLCYIHITGYFSELQCYKQTLNNINCIILYVRSHSEYSIYYMVASVQHSEKETMDKSIKVNGFQRIGRQGWI